MSTHSTCLRFLPTENHTPEALPVRGGGSLEGEQETRWGPRPARTALRSHADSAGLVGKARRTD